MAVSPIMINNNVQNIKKVLTWTAPAIAIPGLRYTQDSHQQRKELFIRDASTYSVGAMTFFATEWLCQKTLDRFKIIKNTEHRSLAAFMVGLTANLLYAGIGAVRFSKVFSRYQAEKSAKKTALENTLSPASSQPPEHNLLPSQNWNIVPLSASQFQYAPQSPPRMQYLA